MIFIHTLTEPLLLFMRSIEKSLSPGQLMAAETLLAGMGYSSLRTDINFL